MSYEGLASLCLLALFNSEYAWLGIWFCGRALTKAFRRSWIWCKHTTKPDSQCTCPPTPSPPRAGLSWEQGSSDKEVRIRRPRETLSQKKKRELKGTGGGGRGGAGGGTGDTTDRQASSLTGLHSSSPSQSLSGSQTHIHCYLRGLGLTKVMHKSPLAQNPPTSPFQYWMPSTVASPSLMVTVPPCLSNFPKGISNSPISWLDRFEKLSI